MAHIERTNAQRRAVTAPTLGALGLFLFVAVLLLTSTKGTQDYRTGQNALFAFMLIFSALFVTRLVWLGRLTLRMAITDRASWNAYVRSGALAIDASFMVSATVFLLLADLSFWRDYTVRVGTVAAIVLVRTLVGIVNGLRWMGNRK